MSGPGLGKAVASIEDALNHIEDCASILLRRAPQVSAEFDEAILAVERLSHAVETAQLDRPRGD